MDLLSRPDWVLAAAAAKREGTGKVAGSRDAVAQHFFFLSLIVSSPRFLLLQAVQQLTREHQQHTYTHLLFRDSNKSRNLASAQLSQQHWLTNHTVKVYSSVVLLWKQEKANVSILPLIWSFTFLLQEPSSSVLLRWFFSSLICNFIFASHLHPTAAFIVTEEKSL